MRNKILKFRAWDGLNKKFSYWTMNDLCTYAEKDEKPNALDDWQRDTGLLDRHDKEIYEGDIVRNENDKKPNQQVIFARGMFCLDDEDSPLWKYGTKDWWEVIGNIYENPELLPTNQ